MKVTLKSHKIRKHTNNLKLYNLPDQLAFLTKQYLDIISLLVRPVINSIQAASHVILRDPLV